ncbi:NADH-cytochrome b5 reductase-like protein isoform X3 [Lycium barbarum]|uniref:NADH-cytochrome b5 reductase-like protein isoform X3 n=1 Tax=Lycium barbarum TaxID=112863 RepID=UPI00293F7134|nr:NADH-cytochrome b5 reductase-like protein isoform X3 [Lycium barbarum]
MRALLRKVAKAAAAPVAFSGHSKSNFANPIRFPFGAIAAVTGCVSYYYSYSSPNNLVYLEQINEDSGQKAALNPDKWIEFKLQDRAPVSHNSHLFSYTPISDPEANGYFDLLIKVYPEGKMSQHFASLKPGDVLAVKGPIEKLRYSPNMKKHIGMIAGGSGITPMLQVIEAILKNPDDNTQVSLVYANVSPDDILLKKKLDVLAATHLNLKVFYTVDNPTNDWRGGIGYVSKDMVVKGLPLPGDDTLILVCGPPGMIKHLSGEKPNPREQGELTGLLKDVGFTKNMVYKF